MWQRSRGSNIFFRRVVSLVCIVVSACALLWYINQSRLNVSAAPFAPGSISGVITNEAGEPLSYMWVHLFPYPFSSGYPGPGNANPSLVRVTDSQGRYSFPLLEPGDYRLLARDPSRVSARQFYKDASQYQEALDLKVRGNVLDDINIKLPTGAWIQGSLIVTNSTIGYYPTELTVYEKVDDSWQIGDFARIGTNGGAFSLGGLSTGIYRICATINDYTSEIFRGCYKQNVASNPNDLIAPVPVEDASDVSITAGETINGLDIVMVYLGGSLIDPNSPGISGQVTDLSGTPIASIGLVAYQRDNPSSAVGYATTNFNGEYLIPLYQSGDIVIQFNEYFYGAYERQYYKQANSFELATPIHLVAGERINHINAQLAVGGRITGTIAVLGSGNNDVSSYYIAPQLFAQNASGEFILLGAAQLRIDYMKNQYSISGLPSGTYRLGMTVWTNTPVTSWYSRAGNATSLESATDIVVNRSQTVSNIDIFVGANDFDGTIQGKVLAGGVPQVGIKVSFYRDLSLVRQINLTTDSKGEYHMEGLRNGVYQVRFSDPTNQLASVFYGQTPLLTQATMLTISGKSVYSDINVSMVTAGQISGTLRLYNNEALKDAAVSVYWLGNNSSVEYVSAWTTDTQGKFAVLGLLPGRYRLYFTHPRLLSTVPYGTYNPDTNQYDPIDITVTSGQSTPLVMVIAAPTASNKTDEPLPSRILLPFVSR
ncbi:MAG: carboxypeptidase-like regulatory domain-containing protein [Caldilineaceae bacterium]